MRHLMSANIIVLVDPPVDLQDQEQVLFHLGANCDFSRDLELVRGPTDVLDHASQHFGWTGKLGIDATKKWKDEGFTRDWPEYLAMDAQVKAKVEEQMRKLGVL